MLRGLERDKSKGDKVLVTDYEKEGPPRKLVGCVQRTFIVSVRKFMGGTSDVSLK